MDLRRSAPVGLCAELPFPICFPDRPVPTRPPFQLGAQAFTSRREQRISIFGTSADKTAAAPHLQIGNGHCSTRALRHRSSYCDPFVWGVKDTVSAHRAPPRCLSRPAVPCGILARRCCCSRALRDEALLPLRSFRRQAFPADATTDTCCRCKMFLLGAQIREINRNTRSANMIVLSKIGATAPAPMQTLPPPTGERGRTGRCFAHQARRIVGNPPG